jgi:hypothetical protein
MNIYDHPNALALAAARDASDHGTAAIRQHLSGCIACRVRAARLQHASSPGDPSEDSVTRILAGSSPGPGILASMTTVRDQDPPRPGEIWRIGRDEALLVWIRRVFDDAVDVIPASLDLELADQESLFLPEESSPLGLPLVLLTGVRTHIGLPGLLQRVGFFDASGCVQEIISAAREGRIPEGIQTGPPIETEDDPRIEYRQVIADLLADLSPGSWTDDTECPIGENDAGIINDVSEIIEMLRANLVMRHAGCRILPVNEHRVTLADSISLASVARIAYLDTSIVVVALDGSRLEDVLRGGQSLADACLEFVHVEPDAAAIAVAERGFELPTVVLKVAQLRTAFEPPGGPEVAPRLSHEPLPIVDALAKFLDRQGAAWEPMEPVTAAFQESNFRDLALRRVAEAIDSITAQGQRALTPAKRVSWTNLPNDLGSRIVDSMSAIMANEPVDAVLDALIERETR